MPATFGSGQAQLAAHYRYEDTVPSMAHEIQTIKARQAPARKLRAMGAAHSAPPAPNVLKFVAFFLLKKG